jgi:hypothetical protein
MPACRVYVALLLCAAATPAAAQELSNRSFQIEYDASGIRSLKRTADVHDTDYVAANGRLGPLLVRYRTTRHGDWRELRQMRLTGDQPGRSITYTLGVLEPTLASRSSGSAQTGAGGIRALNDGVVPAAPVGGGRGFGPGPAGAGAADVPVFSWSGARGPTQWVQYVFPDDQEVASVEVFWVRPPQSWRVIYQDAGQWKDVSPRGPYAVAPNAFAKVEFAPVKTMAMRIEATMDKGDTVSLAEWRVGREPAIVPSPDLGVEQTFTLEADRLDWRITLRNTGSNAAEIGDLAVPFNLAERTGARGDIYTKKLLRHAYVGGHGSFVYWQRANGVGPYLVATPTGDTKFEYFDSSGGFGAFTPYVHAAAASAASRAAGGRWRLPVSALTIPAGGAVTYGFRFRWAKDFAGVRDALYEEGKFDTAVVPGMVVPVDLDARVALRTANRITAVEPEHPSATVVERVARTGAAGTAVYRVRFSQLGENMLRVRYGDGHWASLEFFVTEPLETVIKKRASFLVTRHQHADLTKWYAGAYGDWDQKNERLRGPEDRDGLSTWLTDANDDAGNARPAFVASKNVFFPDETEIASLELYISRYLWGGMQMTDTEKYPYAIYGIPNFKANRASADPGRNGQSHVWRIYDYPHIVMLYHRMYQIAKFYPDKVKHLDAATYLERAYRTAVAYWTVPIAVEKWSANAVGTMNEAFIPELVDALEREGRQEWADTLRGHWESKVERFVMNPPNLYGSEFAFDSTGFESTGAFAKYALTREAPGFRQRVPLEAARTFTDFQLLLNMSDRGWLEPTYYQLGSDYRGNLSYLLSYMSQLGGWAILDYGLHLATDPADHLRLGYASSLSSWALVNSGTAASGHGYWFPGRNNDGAAGGGFMPEPIGRAWIGKQVVRGAWHYSAEADVGFCGALRAHATIVTKDPAFGEFAYGGVLTRIAGAVSVVPRDGLRVRFHVVRDDERLHLRLERDGFAKDRPIVVSDGLDRLDFVLENRTGDAHETGVWIAGLPKGRYGVTVDGRQVGKVNGGRQETDVRLPVPAAPAARVVITRLSPAS